MPKTSDDPKAVTPNDTAEYSATKAPENRPHVTSKGRSGDAALQPGGLHGAPVPVGMEALDPNTVDTAVADEHTDYGANPAKERAGTGKE